MNHNLYGFLCIVFVVLTLAFMVGTYWGILGGLADAFIPQLVLGLFYLCLAIICAGIAMHYWWEMQS